MLFYILLPLFMFFDPSFKSKFRIFLSSKFLLDYICQFHFIGFTEADFDLINQIILFFYQSFLTLLNYACFFFINFWCVLVILFLVFSLQSCIPGCSFTTLTGSELPTRTKGGSTQVFLPVQPDEGQKVRGRSRI